MSKACLLIFICLSIPINAQNFTEPEIYSWYDNQIGIENSSLFRGIEYVEEHRMINEKHKFFKSNMFQSGVVTYDGQFFNDVILRFNVYDDVLVVNLLQGKRNSFFQLISSKVNSFQVNNHKFRFLNPSNSSINEGFYEVISEEGNFKIFKKHIKKRKEQNDKNLVYFEFIDKKPDYVFQFYQEYYELNNKRGLFLKFPDHKKKLKDFYKNYRDQFRNTPDIFMNNLSKEINTLTNKKTK